MSININIDPVTRISGFLDIQTELENDTVINAKTGGQLFRGFEKMLRGRPPLDAVYFTERICGICSSSHAVASSLALQDALKINPDINDLYIRDIIHGFEFLQNHLRQFYFFTIPDYVKMVDISPLSPQNYDDFRLSDKLTEKINKDYLACVTYSRLAHEGLAVLGGKAPHNHGITAFGTTVIIDAYKLQKIKSILDQIRSFVESSMLEDMSIIAEHYKDYFEIGRTYGNFMSFGLFNYKDPDISFIKPGVMINGKREELEPDKITENISQTWYKDNNLELDVSKPSAYTFIKAARYKSLPMEGGPLARLMLNGEYTRGNSCMDRNAARVMETKKIIGIMEKIIDRIQIKATSEKIYEMPSEASGMGLTDTIRGTLGHWISIKDKLIDSYNIITPTGWNLSPMDEKGIHGPAEKALIGTKIVNIKSPVEPGRIIRSFDPCISCATHVISKNREPIDIKLL